MPRIPDRRRIEMRLISRDDHNTEIEGRRIVLRAGEQIHTEISHKFDPDDFDAEAASAGFARVGQWFDDQQWFRVALYEVP